MNRIVATWVHGAKAEKFHAAFGDALESYALRVTGRPPVILRHPPPTSSPLCPCAGKFEAYGLLNHYEAYLFADADVWFGPDAPDLFALTPAGFLGCQWEDEWGEQNTIWFRERANTLILQAGVGHTFWHLPGWDTPCNSGVYVVDKSCASFLIPHPRPECLTAHVSEEDWQQVCAIRANRLHVWPVNTVYSASTNSPNKLSRPIHHYAGKSHPPELQTKRLHRID